MQTVSVRRTIQLTATLALAAALVAAPAHRSASAGHGVRPADITWETVPGYPAGYQRAMLEGQTNASVPVTYRVRLPGQFRFKPHIHSWDEHVTVLKGTWYVGFGKRFDESRMEKFEAGSFVIIPGGIPHYVLTHDETIVQVHGVGPVGLTFVTPSEEKQ